MVDVDIPTIATAILTIAGLGLPVVAVYLVKAKGKLSALRALVDELDDGLKDDKITEEEYGRIVERVKNLVA